MNPVVQAKVSELVDLCRKHRVRRLARFGSAARDSFDPTKSAVDLLVEFEPLPAVEHADCYFGLQEDLQGLFGVAVDLVEAGAIRNPYFLEAISHTQVALFEAACGQEVPL